MAAPVADYTRLPDTHLAEHESDPEGLQAGYIRATDYSLPYTSNWSRIHVDECAKLLRCLNCSYLSTPGVPPTLVALKQHAQALCNLISLLVPTLRTGEVDADNKGPATEKFWENDAFDFLNDLSKAYTSDDPHHHMPLNSLLNEVIGRSDIYGTEYHCPLKDDGSGLPPRAKGEAVRPYANHHNLIMHANACLERLDHEFSTEGGLMAILPGDEPHEQADKAAARNSLLGQWLGFTQHLVRRTHELEISYGNALDVLNGDAAVPYQTLSSLGLPDARNLSRQIAYPQDKWLLANAGDDVFKYIHKVLDTQEVVANEKEKIWKAQGVSGEAHWFKERGGKEQARGIIHVNLATRYYRLAGTGHGTIFVVPAHDHHPGVQHTAVLEKQPRIIGTPMATFPERVSEMEKRVREEKEVVDGRMRELEGVGQRVVDAEGDVRRYKDELERVWAEKEALEEVVSGELLDPVSELGAVRKELEETKRELAAARRQRALDGEAVEGRGGDEERQAMQVEIARLRRDNFELNERWAYNETSDM